MKTLIAALLFASAALAETPARVGLYPLALPDDLGQRVAAQLHDGAAALPRVKAFDLVAHSNCAPDDGPCLAQAARRAGLDAMISAQITPRENGYAYRLRAFAAGGEPAGEVEHEVTGGPLDLAAGLEGGVCELLGGAPCTGELRVAGEPGAHLFVDGRDAGPLPVTTAVPVGRHSVRAGSGGSERRVRVSYGRSTTLFAAMRQGEVALVDQPDAAVPAAALPGVTVLEARQRASRVLFAGGAGLLAAAAGVALYAQTQSAAPAPAGRTAALVDVNRAAVARRSSLAAMALAATGAGAVVASGLVLLLTPDSAALQTRF